MIDMKSENQLTQNELDTIATYMDDDIREYIHNEFAPCEPIFFLEEYCKRDVNFVNVLKVEFGLKIEV